MEKNRDKRIGLIVILVLLAALMIGGTMLYNALMDSAMMPQVRTQPVEPAETAADEADENAMPAVTVAPAVTGAVQEKPAEAAGPKPMANLAKVFNVYTDAGEKVNLIDMRGKPTVVNFFASWCGPCKMEMPHFEEAYKTYGEEINFMMVNLCAYGNDTKENGKALVAEGGWTFPVYFDTEGEAVVAYSVRSMPTTIFVSADGELVTKRIGMLTKEQLQSDIDNLLAK